MSLFSIFIKTEKVLVFWHKARWYDANGIWNDCYAYYQIYHYPKTNNYKLKVQGMKPKKHGDYPAIVEKLNNYRKFGWEMGDGNNRYIEKALAKKLGIMTYG